MTLLLLFSNRGADGPVASAFRDQVAALDTQAAVELVIVSELRSLQRKLEGTVSIAHLAIDRHGFDEGVQAGLGQILDSVDKQGRCPISIFYDLMSREDVTEALTRAWSDQIIEVRDDSDVLAPCARIIEHVRNSMAPTPDDAVQVGSIFKVKHDEYRTARARSLLSHRQSSFISDLSKVIHRLLRHPLVTSMPWEPSSATTLERAKNGRIPPPAGRLPTLADLFNSDYPKALETLRGETVGDQDWQRAWANQSKPPLVLLTGESGTGKTLVARTIAEVLQKHQVGVRSRYEKINTAGLVGDKFDHLLFGAAPRQWSGIEEATPGQLAVAAHGVVFFDEIGDADPEVQRRLLTFFDDREIRPTGVAPFRGFQHIIAATNRDVEEGARQAWFRNDLLARFAVRLHVPPLRDRGEQEIGQLVDYLAQDPMENPTDGDTRRVNGISKSAFDELSRRTYASGNFRELTLTVHGSLRSAISRHSPIIESADLPEEVSRTHRADREVGIVHSPDVVEISFDHVAIAIDSEDNLRHLAHRENRTIVADPDGTLWVFTPGVAHYFNPQGTSPTISRSTYRVNR